MARVRANWIDANAVTMHQMGRRGAHGARHYTSQKALSNVSNFYQMQLFRKLNVHCMNEGQREDLIEQKQANVFGRKVSFLSIAPQLKDIDALTGNSFEQPLPRIDKNSQSVLEEVLRTIMLNHRIVEADAVTGALRGERGLPLTVDGNGFGNFLDGSETLLASVIEACEHDADRSARLAPLLQTLATDYFSAAGRLPKRPEAAVQQFFNGLPVPEQPVSVLVGDLDESGGFHLVDMATKEEQVLLTIGNPIVAGALSSCQSLIKGFETRSLAKQRAGVVLQALFFGITNAEESIIGCGFQCSTEDDHLQSNGTARHIGYTGSDHIGDACDLSEDNPYNRMQTSAPLRGLPQLMQEHEATHQAPLLVDPELKKWIEDPCFEHDVSAIACPMLRLPFAQIATTGKLLLQTRAFGGTGITS